MWSDEARAAAAEARKKSSGHNAGKGNRKVASQVKAKHDAQKGVEHYSVAAGALKGALIGSIVPGVGTVAGAAFGAYRASSKNKIIAAGGKKK